MYVRKPPLHDTASSLVSTLTLHLHLGTVRDLNPRVVLADLLHELRVVAAAVHQKAAVYLLPVLKAHRRSLRGVLHLRRWKQTSRTTKVA